MSAPTPGASRPFSHENVCFVLNSPMRWRILRELAKGEALPVQELARRLSAGPAAISNHVAVLRKAGIAVVGFGRLYSLAPSLRTPGGGTTLELGHCLLRLDEV